MEKKELLLRRLEEIGESLARTGKAEALLGLGSVGVEIERLDKYSDLDFFAIVKDGYKNEFIQNIEWLSSIRPVVYKFLNTKDGYKLMFDDEVFCEFAVFEKWELNDIPYAEGKIIWKTEGFDESLRIPKNTSGAYWQPSSIEWIIGEFTTCLYVGLCRYNRGEKLSGYRFIQGYSFDRLMELVEHIEKEKSDFKDKYSRERRFETRFPETAEKLGSFLSGYDKVKESAEAMIEFVDKYYPLNEAMKNVLLNMCK